MRTLDNLRALRHSCGIPPPAGPLTYFAAAALQESPMLNLKRILESLDTVRANNRARGYEVDVDALADKALELRSSQSQYEACRRELRLLSERPSGDDGRLEQGRALRAKQSELSSRIGELTTVVDRLASQLPNILDSRVPVGDDSVSVVLREVGSKPQFSHKPLPHETLGERLGLLDMAGGARIAGRRFYNLKNDAVRLRWILADMFREYTQPMGFELVSPPHLTQSKTLYASGYLPFQTKDNFKIADSDLSLIGTSEQALLGTHIGTTLSELPKLYLGDSMCFRTEAGNYGRDTAGIFRVHQFYKLEQFVYCHPDEAEEWHQRCLQNEEWLMQALEIPYRVVLTSSDDLAAPGKIKYDIEAWIPAQGKYREVTSNTNLGDFQTRRGNIRFKVGGQKGYPHTISATGFCDRLIIALMENYQTAEGTITVPSVLRGRLGKALIKG